MWTLPAVAHIRGEGLVWGVECAPIGSGTAADTAKQSYELKLSGLRLVPSVLALVTT